MTTTTKTPWRRRAPMERDRRHQLVFELVPTVVLLAAVREPLLVLGTAALLLPGVRATWVAWLRAGAGLVPSLLAAMLAGHTFGVPGFVTVWLLAVAHGALASRRDQAA